MEVNPSTYAVLDVSPYNLIAVSCVVEQPAVVTVPKIIEWKMTYNGVMSALAHNGENINITLTDLSEPISKSVLFIREANVGLKLYTCCASSKVPVDLPVIYSESVEVNVKGMQHGKSE